MEDIRYNKFGWVDLSELKHNKDGTINWKDSVGCKIHFKYKDINSFLQIAEYKDSNHLYVCIDDQAYKSLICISTLLKGQFGLILKERTRDFRYKTGDIVNNLLIVDCYKKNGHKYYAYKCIIDGYEGEIFESNLLKGVGCPVCTNRVVKIGVNDIKTTNPILASLFLNEDDATKYTQYSGKKAYFKCPICGTVFYLTIRDVARLGLSCRKCGDGISYPEKVVYNVLQQVSNLHNGNIHLQKFETQKTFEWSKDIRHSNLKLSGNKIYDFYVPLDSEIIIEANGMQHYEELLYGISKNARTLDEEQKNDQLKMELAISNGVLSENYIQLDCRYSDINYIKNSIMLSNLPQLLDFTEDQIDWQECNRFATSSRIYEACGLWNNGNHIVRNIANIMKMNRCTIRIYLRRGFELGILQDPPKYLLKT